MNIERTDIAETIINSLVSFKPPVLWKSLIATATIAPLIRLAMNVVYRNRCSLVYIGVHIWNGTSASLNPIPVRMSTNPVRKSGESDVDGLLPGQAHEIHRSLFSIYQPMPKQQKCRGY